MAERSPIFRVRARGPYACFTRPELKTERVSYEVMTPSAARGILDAILWKPAIRWHVERIHVLSAIRFAGIKRNEVNSKASARADVGAYYADEDRAQRNTLMLCDVDYVIEAHFTMTLKAGPQDNMRKFVEMFGRRLLKGQCFHTPYLGCREFAADVQPAPEKWPVHDSLAGERDLGMMLNDLDFADERPPHERATIPHFFAARLKDGVLDVPQEARP
jgi:CRISPR-associated protein Cas5d